MTWLANFLLNMGLLFTGFNMNTYIPQEDTGTVIDTGSFEYQINYLMAQHDIIVEDYFTFADRFPSTKYARGCVGGYEPEVYKDGKKYNCWKSTFDCAGMMKAYGFVKWLLDKNQLAHYNSQTLYELGVPIDPRMAQRGDFTYRRGFGDRSTGNNSTHFAVISREYSGWTIGIFDYTKNKPMERILKVSCNATYCSYAGRFRIYIASNGFEELAQQKGITVDPFIKIDTWASVSYMPITWGTPVKTVLISWFAINSQANAISQFWYEWTSGDTEIIATFQCEAHFNDKAVGKKGEKGICQLLPNRTNNVRLNDPRRKDPMWQAKICMEKRKAVPNKANIRSCYKQIAKYKKNILITTKI